MSLPDLPNAGYSTVRERMLSDSVCMIMREMERNRLRLINVVLGGLDRWKRFAMKDLGRELRPDDELLTCMFRHFELWAVADWDLQQKMLRHAKNPDKWRECMREAWPGLLAQRDKLASMANTVPGFSSVS